MTNGESQETGKTPDKPQGLGAYETLRREILHGELMPGERLRVSELNNRYRIGLTPIREALMRLTSEGLVQNESHRGARVKETTLDELRDIMSARRDIERLCLTRAMERGDAEWEANILRAFHLLSRAALPGSVDDMETASRWEQLHRQFHYSLVEACRSDWLLRFWNTLADHSERYRKLRLLYHESAAAAVRNANAEHEEIMNAVIGRKAAACDLMDVHLGRTEEAVARLMERDRASEGKPR